MTLLASLPQLPLAAAETLAAQPAVGCPATPGEPSLHPPPPGYQPHPVSRPRRTGTGRRPGHAEALDASRPVRDISLISDEILTPLSTASAHVRITVDIESADLEKLNADQVTALKGNLATLGFTDWIVEELAGQPA